MALSPEERAEVWRAVMSSGQHPDVFKVEVRAAVDAVDDWIDANIAALRLALAQRYRSGATGPHLTTLFALVLKKRLGERLISLSTKV